MTQVREKEVARSASFKYRTISEFSAALADKDAFGGKYELYPRDGSPALTRLEEHVAELVDAKEGGVLLFNSGMSAVVTAIELASPKEGEAVIHGDQEYSQVRGYINQDLKTERGVRSIEVDQGSLKEVDYRIKAFKPKLVLLETAANGTRMAFLDVKRFLALKSLREANPLIILDNTLPTNSNYPLASFMRENPGLRIIGVESGTKFYALNQELAGIAFTYNPEVFEQLQRKRRKIGSILGPSATEKIQSVIPPSKSEFDRANRLIAKNTYALAKVCLEAEKVNGKFNTGYPNLPNNPNKDVVNTYSPNGISPVLFIESWEVKPAEINRALWEDPVIRENADLAQSFGLSRTSLSYNPDYRYVRVAGGMESPDQIAELQEAFYRVLSKI
ncbi:hypothetical protein C4559_04850 [Candidatus Microgenomates bacterium]|nr:MAG: hypothetical protein C4559_04850 [Candidatus Microgenomates bacterium]